MAVGAPTGLAGGSDSTSLSSYVTASQSPTADRLILAIVLSTAGSDINPLKPTSLTGNGLTWVWLDGNQFSTSATLRRRIDIYAALTGSSPSAGTVTIAYGATQDGIAWSFAEFAGTHLTSIDDAIRQVRLGEAPNTHLSCEAYLWTGQSANNAIWCGMGKAGDAEAVSVGSGYTEIHEAAITAPASIVHTEYRLGTATLADASWTTTSREASSFAVELRAATEPIDIRQRDTIPR